MEDPRLTDLRLRVERLERSRARRPALVAAALATGWALGLTVPPALAPPRILEAERLVIRDASGTVRGALGLAPDGSSGLALADRSGRLRLSLLVGADAGPSVSLFDAEERNRAALAVSPEGAAGLTLYDRRGDSRAALMVRADGSPEVVLQRR